MNNFILRLVVCIALMLLNSKFVQAQIDTVAGGEMVVDTTIHNTAEQMPEFPGGDTALQKFFQENIRYPHLAMEQGHQGIVYVSYVVEKDGRITNIGIQKGIDGAPELEKEAMRVVSKFPDQIPGRNAGVPVRVNMVMPIKFALQ